MRRKESESKHDPSVLLQNPTESEVKKLVVEHRADDRVTFEQFLPMMQVNSIPMISLWGSYRDQYLSAKSDEVLEIYTMYCSI